VLEALQAKKVLKDVPVERVTFNAITKDAVATASPLRPAILQLPQHMEVLLGIDRAVFRRKVPDMPER
jgi:hypothetical protein